MAKTLFPETGDADPQASRAASTVSRTTRYSSLHSKVSSMTSIQRKRELQVAKLRRLEIERQNETGIRLKEKENELALETLVEENKRKLNEAKIVETELMNDDSDIDTDINKTALPSSRTQQVVAETRTKDWVAKALDTHSSELASTITIVPRQEPQPPSIANLVSLSLPPSTVDLIIVHLFPSSSNPSVCLPLQSVVSSTVHNLKIPSQPLPPLHCLKSLVKDKAETAIAEFAYSGTMYKYALMKLERKFGQPQIITRAYYPRPRRHHPRPRPRPRFLSFHVCQQQWSPHYMLLSQLIQQSIRQPDSYYCSTSEY